jgi:nucleoside-diphosphate-sugar epimerase
MRVFSTGASGHIASAVIPELLSAGHAVTGLARSDRSAAVVQSLGAEVWRGLLDDLDGLSAVREADGVIHLAFNEDEVRPESVIVTLHRNDMSTRGRKVDDRSPGSRGRTAVM